jgi:hypothetical protein
MDAVQRTDGDGIGRLKTVARATLFAAALTACLTAVGTAAAENVTSAAPAGDVGAAQAAGAQLPGATAPAAAAGILVGVLVAVTVFTYRELE